RMIMKTILRSLTLPLGGGPRRGARLCGSGAGGERSLLLQGDDLLGRLDVVPDGGTVPLQGRRLEGDGFRLRGGGGGCDLEAVHVQRDLVFHGRRELSERDPVPLRGRSLDEPVDPVFGW